VCRHREVGARGVGIIQGTQETQHPEGAEPQVDHHQQADGGHQPVVHEPKAAGGDLLLFPAALEHRAATAAGGGELVFFQRLQALLRVLVEDDDQAQPDQQAAEHVVRGELEDGVAAEDAKEQQGQPHRSLQAQAEGGDARGFAVGLVVDSHLKLRSICEASWRRAGDSGGGQPGHPSAEPAQHTKEVTGRARRARARPDEPRYVGLRRMGRPWFATSGPKFPARPVGGSPRPRPRPKTRHPCHLRAPSPPTPDS
jgi:hypothetical protein